MNLVYLVIKRTWKIFGMDGVVMKKCPYKAEQEDKECYR